MNYFMLVEEVSVRAFISQNIINSNWEAIDSSQAKAIVKFLVLNINSGSYMELCQNLESIFLLTRRKFAFSIAD